MIGGGLLFTDGVLSTAALDARTEQVVLVATDRAERTVRSSDFLAAAISVGDRHVLAALAMALEPGAEIEHVRQIIDLHHPPARGVGAFDGDRDRFSPAALRAVDEFGTAYASARDQVGDAGLELLMVSVLQHLDTKLAILDTEVAVRVLRERVGQAAAPPVELFDTRSGLLRAELFTETAWLLLEHACGHAADLGYERVLPPHVLIALLGETEGVAERLVRLQVPAHVGPAKVAAAIADGIRLSERAADPLRPHRGDLGESTAALLREAVRVARVWDVERAGSQHLLAALLDDPPTRVVPILEREPIRLDLPTARRHLDQALRDMKGGAPPEVPFRLPGDLLPAEDLTHTARTDGIPAAPHLDAHVDEVVRALHRRSGNHVLITGDSGVGRTTAVRELARRATAGAIPFLRHKRFLWVDGRDVAPADSGRKLAAVIGHVSGRTDLVLCLDGLGPLLRGESGTDHRVVLRAALKAGRVRMVGVVDSIDFEDLLAGDRTLRALTTRVEVREPDRDIALDMVRQAADALAEEFGLGIEPKAVERAVALSADYVLHDRLPGKAVTVLRQACEDLDFDRGVRRGERTAVGVDDVVAVVSRISGVPESQLSGVATGGDDYERALGAEVVGQSQAVAAVAEELRLIKFGLRLGSVLFFGGQTGVGKSELAKVLARFYSASKRLQVYAMGNFTEAHSVSGIIGVPAGYHGHDRGGRLINELNADPYCVFLLDEAERAHPDVWKPFLNLFDEGWIEDQRGVRAHADRAIFILTSNAGADLVSELSARGAGHAEITRAVRDYLPTLRHRSTHEVVFPPEFLARIRRTIVFAPLDRAAMLGITRKLLERRQRFWWENREKRLVVPEALVEHIAAVADAENRAAHGREGGRVVDKLIADLVEDAIVRVATREPDGYLSCGRIELTFHPGPPAGVGVRFTAVVD